jgi:hypothetical protein
VMDAALDGIGDTAVRVPEAHLLGARRNS